MFARNMTLKLQPNHLMRFIETYDETVLSILKKQKGFRGEVAVITAMGEDVVATSYWESREAVDAYHNSGLLPVAVHKGALFNFFFGA